MSEYDHVEQMTLLQQRIAELEALLAKGLLSDGLVAVKNLRERNRGLEQQLAAVRSAVEKREHCATCGKPFTEGNRIEVVSDEFTLHYVCWPECPPAEEGCDTLALLKDGNDHV